MAGVPLPVAAPGRAGAQAEVELSKPMEVNLPEFILELPARPSGKPKVDFAKLFSESYRARDHDWKFTYNGDSPTFTIEDDS
jgi:hypothetical protein